MEQITTANGTRVSYEKYGEGPPLVLVHGGFSDQDTNWEFVKPMLAERFRVYAVARRGRGQTDRTEGHSLEDEARDVVAVMRAVGEPVYLLGHSYGAQCALSAAAMAPELVRKLVLYEAPWPSLISQEKLAILEGLAEMEDWDGLSYTFFHDVLHVPNEELEPLRSSELWAPIMSDAKATCSDLKALARHTFDPERYRSLDRPVLLQIGTESPRELYVTDALAGSLPNAKVEALEGQAHEGMTTAPQQYAEAVTRFLLA